MKNLINVIELNGAWTVRGAQHFPDGLPARVPGCIHEDLLRQGLLENPFIRSKKCRAFTEIYEEPSSFFRIKNGR